MCTAWATRTPEPCCALAALDGVVDIDVPYLPELLYLFSTLGSATCIQRACPHREGWYALAKATFCDDTPSALLSDPTLPWTTGQGSLFSVGIINAAAFLSCRMDGVMATDVVTAASAGYRSACNFVAAVVVRQGAALAARLCATFVRCSAVARITAPHMGTLSPVVDAAVACSWNVLPDDVTAALPAALIGTASGVEYLRFLPVDTEVVMPMVHRSRIGTNLVDAINGSLATGKRRPVLPWTRGFRHTFASLVKHAIIVVDASSAERLLRLCALVLGAAPTADTFVSIAKRVAVSPDVATALRLRDGHSKAYTQLCAALDRQTKSWLPELLDKPRGAGAVVALWVVLHTYPGEEVECRYAPPPSPLPAHDTDDATIVRHFDIGFDDLFGVFNSATFPEARVTDVACLPSAPSPSPSPSPLTAPTPRAPPPPSPATDADCVMVRLAAVAIGTVEMDTRTSRLYTDLIGALTPIVGQLPVCPASTDVRLAWLAVVAALGPPGRSVAGAAFMATTRVLTVSPGCNAPEVALAVSRAACGLEGIDSPRESELGQWSCTPDTGDVDNAPMAVAKKCVYALVHPAIVAPKIEL